jgi:transcriptional regulator with XRE-family HTH domain
MPIQPVQCRMARAALGWSLQDLSVKTGVAKGVLNRFEFGGDIRASKRDAIEAAFQGTGIDFRPDGSVWAPEVQVNVKRSESQRELAQARRAA